MTEAEQAISPDKKKRRGGRSFDLDKRPPHQQRRKEKAQDEDWIKDFIKSVPMGYFGLRWDE